MTSVECPTCHSTDTEACSARNAWQRCLGCGEQWSRINVDFISGEFAWPPP